MPDPGKAEESTLRTNSVGIVVKGDQSLSFASCPTCPGPNRTPTLHADQCMSVDSTHGGKASTDGEVDNKLINAASSSSTPVETRDKSSACMNPLCTFQSKFHSITLKESADVIGVPADGTASARLAEVAAPESLNPGSANVLIGKRKAGATKDRPESKINRRAATIAANPDSKLFWENREERIFQDLPGSSGRLDPCIPLLAELWNAEQMNIQLMDHNVHEGASLRAPPFATVQTAGFSCDFLNPAGGTISLMDESLINDPDRLGLERLNIFVRNEEEPTLDLEQL